MYFGGIQGNSDRNSERSARRNSQTPDKRPWWTHDHTDLLTNPDLSVLPAPAPRTLAPIGRKPFLLLLRSRFAAARATTSGGVLISSTLESQYKHWCVK